MTIINKDIFSDLIPKKNRLQNKEIDLIVADFDDTIFSRKEQFENDDNYVKLRGNKGNEYTKNVLGIENLIKLYYKDKKYPDTISSKLRENHDLILTAGFDDIQKEKIKATGLNNINHIVVYESIEKPYQLVKYIVENLKFIPNKITIYEDRPQVFIDSKEQIENFLNTKVEIFFVDLKSNDENPIIKKV